ncbi:S-layer homology domain-containing protein [Lysinibacillus sp. NPDC096418]|uniref:CAP and S-layer homology domain-containing protein n=1 Tax=Lysinibacillus sp. NPDC096418 TaxID=3364138 RepID=UPI003827505E
MKIVHKGLFTAALTLSLITPVVIAPVAQASSDFQDVPKNHTYYKEISTLQKSNILNSYNNNIFKPAANISRQDVAAWLNRAFDLEPIREGITFKDVPKTSAYYNDIQAVYRAGIVDGNATGNFNPTSPLQRGQMAKVLVNTLKLELSQQRVQFSDTKSHWSAPYVQTLVESGITTGYGNGLFKPDDMVSRQHYAVFLYRVIELLENDKPVEDSPVIDNEKVDETELENYVIKLVNEHRATQGLSPLTKNSLLTNAAEKRAMEIVDHFSHNRPNGDKYVTAVQEQNYNWGYAAENIAKFSTQSITQKSAETLFNMWKNSQGHNANMLSKDAEDIGIGIYINSYGVHGVQLFGKQLN